ncbi:MAG: hypothetical protein VYC95_01065, partial [Verrucomicrobiota bacterium]|nr:hypothetical protein [Verrucomicrobiota bacterium]
VTLASWVLAGLAFLGFLQGWFAAGLLAAWAMTFLDTVDGNSDTGCYRGDPQSGDRHDGSGALPGRY